MADDEEPPKIIIDTIEKELQPELKAELNKILDGDYSRGAFCGMCTNIYFDFITNNPKAEPIGVDMIIKQALLVRLQAYKMAGDLKTKTEPETKTEKSVPKLVM